MSVDFFSTRGFISLYHMLESTILVGKNVLIMKIF